MTAYLVLGGVGLAVVVLSLLLGDLLEGVTGGLAGDWFSAEVVGGFLSALGFGGAAALRLGVPDGVAAAVGVGLGVVVAVLAAGLTRVVRGGGTDATPEVDHVIGHEALVLSAVPEDGFGTVEVRLGGHTIRYHARAELPLDPGTRVHVTGTLSPTAVTVAPL